MSSAMIDGAFGDRQLPKLAIETITQINRPALPRLSRGPNRIQLRVGPQVETDFNNFEALNIPKSAAHRLLASLEGRTDARMIQMGIVKQEWPLTPRDATATARPPRQPGSRPRGPARGADLGGPPAHALGAGAKQILAMVSGGIAGVLGLVLVFWAVLVFSRAAARRRGA